MAGIRDKLIHEYFGINLEVVWDTVRIELSALQIKLQRIAKDLK